MKTVEGCVKLDENNPEFNLAVQAVLETQRNIFLTGKAGAGKTTFLKYISTQLNGKDVAIVAPTGVAAINAKGQTIHSFFRIKPSVYPLTDKRLRLKAPDNDSDRSTFYDHFSLTREAISIIEHLQVLIIDEISMVRCDLLDVINTILQIRRNRRDLPWGGVQVLLIGDPFQLPPVAKEDEWEILKSSYETPFFFSAKSFNDSNPIYIELKKIYRQTELDYINLLNKIRKNDLEANDLNYINSRYEPNYKPRKNEIVLTTHNRTSSEINNGRMSELSTEPFIYQADINGEFPEKDFPTEKNLLLKVGAQVMFIKNNPSKKYYNGKIGEIIKLSENKIIIEIDKKDAVEIEKSKWHNIKYTWDKAGKRILENVCGTFTQFPLKLAWAITVHKSQGLTFENVYADLGGAFAPGQVYVALSRCTSLNGLRLKSRIKKDIIKASTDVINFTSMELPETLLVEELDKGKTDLIYQESWDLLKKGQFSESYDKLIEAMRLRNDLEKEYFRKIVITFLKRNQRNWKKFKKYEKAHENMRRDIEVVSDKVADKEKTIKKLESDIEKIKKERDYYKNLKWYQKLFG